MIVRGEETNRGKDGQKIVRMIWNAIFVILFIIVNILWNLILINRQYQIKLFF